MALTSLTEMTSLFAEDRIISRGDGYLMAKLIREASEPLDLCFPDGFDGLAFMYCHCGEMSVTINAMTYRVEKSYLVTSLPGDQVNVSRMHDYGEDIDCSVCILSKELTEALEHNIPDASETFLPRAILLSKSESAEYESFASILTTISRHNDTLANESIRSLLNTMRLEAYRAWKTREMSAVILPHYVVREKQLASRFVSLLKQHCAKERKVQFYLDALSVTSRQLSLAVRKTNHMTVKALIDITLKNQIQSRLLYTSMSIKDLSMQFNFPNQKALCQFYQRHTGFSPSSHRKLMLSRQ